MSAASLCSRFLASVHTIARLLINETPRSKLRGVSFLRTDGSQRSTSLFARSTCSPARGKLKFSPIPFSAHSSSRQSRGDECACNKILLIEKEKVERQENENYQGGLHDERRIPKRNPKNYYCPDQRKDCYYWHFHASSISDFRRYYRTS